MNTLSRHSYPKVKQGHLVAVGYQKGFAIDDQVAVHVDDAEEPVLLNVRKAGTRGPYYRRHLADGTPVDDYEATLGTIEGVALPVLADVVAGAALTFERKKVLCQFLGIQMTRSPAFFRKRTVDVAEAIGDELTPERLGPGVLEQAGGDFDAAREHVVDAFTRPTAQLMGMASVGTKLAVVLGSMRWQLLHFSRPVLAYSDQPVVVWPRFYDQLLPPDRPQFGPLTAIEAAMPLAPDLALLMTWEDRPDPLAAIDMPPEFAGQLNGFVIAQADRQWMHRPGARVPRRRGLIAPLSRQLNPSYTAQSVEDSHRRAQTQRFLYRVRDKRTLAKFNIVNFR